MASRWRRRQVCRLVIGDENYHAALRDISGSGARLECSPMAAIGSPVKLHHPHAGAIDATVSAVIDGGLQIAFDGREAAIAFALGAIAADMSRPA